MEHYTKLVVRTEPGWYRRLKVEAAKRDMKISELVRTAVDFYLKENPVKEAEENGKEKR